MKKIASMAIKKLALQEEKLTGNQVKFIRSYFAMSLREFGNTVVKLYWFNVNLTISIF